MSLIGKNVLFRRLGSEEVFMGEVDDFTHVPAKDIIGLY